MPIHDWTRVTAGTFHAFHVAWMAEMQKAMNHGLLPRGYYALAEQVAGQIGPDVLALQELGREGSNGSPQEPPAEPEERGGLAVAVAPPRVRLTARVSEAHVCAARRRRLVIRHATGDRVVAFLEIVSPGNKDRHSLFQAFLDKAFAAIFGGYHLTILDLFPPGPFDPKGIHAAIWGEIEDNVDAMPEDSPLTLAAYVAAPGLRAYVEPTAVGRPLIDIPLFLDTETYVNVPLEATYQEAWSGVPERWRRVIEEA